MSSTTTTTLEPLMAPVWRVHLERERDITLPTSHIGQPEDAVAIFRGWLGWPDRETVAALYLDAKNRVIGAHGVSVGSVAASIIAGREILKPAVLANAAALILCHTHPSGDPDPSIEDRYVTKRLAELCHVLDVDMLDHIVLGETSWTSLRATGDVPDPGSYEKVPILKGTAAPTTAPRWWGLSPRQHEALALLAKPDAYLSWQGSPFASGGMPGSESVTVYDAPYPAEGTPFTLATFDVLVARGLIAADADAHAGGGSYYITEAGRAALARTRRRLPAHFTTTHTEWG